MNNKRRQVVVDTIGLYYASEDCEDCKGRMIYLLYTQYHDADILPLLDSPRDTRYLRSLRELNLGWNEDDVVYPKKNQCKYSCVESHEAYNYLCECPDEYEAILARCKCGNFREGVCCDSDVDNTCFVVLKCSDRNNRCRSRDNC